MCVIADWLTSDAGPVSLEGNEDVGRGDLVLVCELGNDLVGEQGGVIGSKRRVGSHDNAFADAEVNNILLGARAVWKKKHGRVRT